MLRRVPSNPSALKPRDNIALRSLRLPTVFYFSNSSIFEVARAVEASFLVVVKVWKSSVGSFFFATDIFKY